MFQQPGHGLTPVPPLKTVISSDRLVKGFLGSPTDSHDIWPHEDGSYSLLRSYDDYPQARHQSGSRQTSAGRRLPIVYARRNLWGKGREGSQPIMDGPLLIGDGQDKRFYGLCIDDGQAEKLTISALCLGPHRRSSVGANLRALTMN